MILYGSRVAHIDTEKLDHYTCESCGHTGTVVLSVYRKHAHIYWIPLFPLWKIGVSECTHCKHVLSNDEMVPPLKDEFLRLKSNKRGPLWQYTGLAIVVFLFAFGIYASMEAKITAPGMINDPNVGDVYEFQTSTGGYSTLKVVSFDQDSIYVTPNKYEVKSTFDTNSIEKEENYEGYYYGMTREELIGMHEDGIIKWVVRN